ncbi:Ig-like domain-containing protein [Aciditerrimonas ferrireducens]|jgi:hypothetical protein|uniref:Ig-like domain-containing protein n=1 Tax=Aciditerrimonas ferrireducens TaxID=667306 RepID=UPI002005B3BF|nr:Ig-like domain-containing protein [Aciditerrimonas ferrireducens]MCK4176082.1 Ig-like domain-containing protein [Aciditerrimonas ferrireducens]
MPGPRRQFWGRQAWGRQSWGGRGRRSRWLRRRLPALAGVCLVVAFAVGVGLQVPRAMTAPERALDDGFGGMLGALGKASAATGRALGQSLTTAPSAQRLALLASLQVVDQQARAQAAEAQVDGQAGPAAGASCLVALEDRADAAGLVDQAVGTLLGGATGLGAGSSKAQAQALVGMDQALSLVERSDAAWRSCTGQLARDPGRVQLPGSSWRNGEGIWSKAALAAWVPVVAASPGLQPAPSLALEVPTTRPAAVAGGGTSGPYHLVAVRQLTLQAVLQNTGNVALRAITVSARLVPTGSLGRTAAVSTTLGLAAQALRPVTLPPLEVTPGASYTVLVTASASGGSAGGSVTASSQAMVVSVAQEATVTAVVASANPVAVDQAVTYTATVTPALNGSSPPPGRVVFDDNGAPVPGCGAVALHQGVATCTLAYAHTGLHSVTVSYPGTASLAGSVSPAITVTVTPARRASS